MLRTEFENLLKDESGKLMKSMPSDEDYRLIEFVYNYYPCNFSKAAVASLYMEFDMTLFYDMEARAKLAMEYEQLINEAKGEIKRSEIRLENLEQEYRTLGERRLIEND